MAKTVWSPVTKQNKPYFTEEDTKNIYLRSKLGIRIPAIKNESQLEKIAGQLDYAASWYFEFKNRTNGPKTADLKKSLEHVQKTASAFYECLSDLDFRTIHEHFLLPGFLPVEIFEETKQNVGLIDYRARKVLDEFKTTPHRPRSLGARINFICMLAIIYEETTDKKAGVSRTKKKPAGPFFRFVKNGLEHIGALGVGDEALYKSIDDSLRALSKYKTAIAQARPIRPSH